MKTLNNFILEKLKITKNINLYKYRPNDTRSLIDIINELLLKRGKNANLNDIDTSKITNMSCVFMNQDPHNIDISKWDVSNVKTFHHMFAECNHFNCDLSEWNLQSAKDINHMFIDCTSFTGDGLKNWDISHINDFRSAFRACIKLDIDLSNWKFEYHNSINCKNMFNECYMLKGTGLDKWITTNITNMNSMFYDCKSLNADFSKWDIKNVMNYNDMFYGCTSLKNKPSWYEE